MTRFIVREVAHHPLLDAIRKEFRLRNDGQLCKFLELSAPAVSRMRNHVYGINGDIILRVYDKTGWSIEQIRKLIARAEHLEKE